MNGLRKLWTKAGSRFDSVFKALLLFLVGVYRTIGTPHFGGACRFQPSCSEYAVSALRTHGPWRALSLIAVRLLKCRPGGPWGYDPVPSAGCRK